MVGRRKCWYIIDFPTVVSRLNAAMLALQITSWPQFQCWRYFYIRALVIKHGRKWVFLQRYSELTKTGRLILSLLHLYSIFNNNIQNAAAFCDILPLIWLQKIPPALFAPPTQEQQRNLQTGICKDSHINLSWFQILLKLQLQGPVQNMVTTDPKHWQHLQ